MIQNSLARVLVFYMLLLINGSVFAQENNEAFWAADNNVIELRNDSLGMEFFRCIVMPFPVQPEYKYHLPSVDTEHWETTTGKYGNREFSEVPVWPIEVLYKKGDGFTPNTNYHLFENRNIPKPNTAKIYPGEIDRGNSVSTLSQEYGDFEQDWAFIVNKRDELLAEAGLDSTASDWEKVAVFADYCYQKRVTTSYQKGLYLHPVDFCIHGDICVASANTFAALCSTIDVASRLVSMSNHSNAEVLVDGQWRWVENALARLSKLQETAEAKEKGPLFSYSFLEMIADPVKYHFPADDYYVGITCAKEGRNSIVLYTHELYSNWLFHTYFLIKDGPKYNFRFSLGSARELRLLYPQKDKLTYKSDSIPKMWLTPFRNSVSGENHGNLMVVKQHSAIRQSFYISDLTDVEHVRAYLPVPHKFFRAMPEDGGNWYYQVNDRKFYIRDIGGWNHNYNEEIKNKSLMFDIPLEVLNVDN